MSIWKNIEINKEINKEIRKYIVFALRALIIVNLFAMLFFYRDVCAKESGTYVEFEGNLESEDFYGADFNNFLDQLNQNYFDFGEDSDFLSESDNINPELFVDGLCDKEIYKDSLNFCLKASDDRDGLNIRYKCLLLKADGSKSQLADMTEHIDSNTFEKSLSYTEEGVYEVVFYAYDDAGNASEIRNYSVGLDTNAPEIDFGGFDVAKIYSDKAELSICVKELFYEGLNVDVSVYKTSKDSMIEIPVAAYSVKAVSNKNIYSFEGDGTFLIKVKAYDKALHEATKEIAFTIDKSAPEISIDFDGEEYGGQAFISDNPKVDISISEKNFKDGKLTVSLNKKILSNTGNNKESEVYENIPVNVKSLTGEKTVIPIELKDEGNYDLTVTAVDALGNERSEHINFTIDSNAPSIGFLSEYNEKYLKSFTLPNDLSGYISDVTGVHYKAFLNSKETGSGEIKKDGKYILQVVAWDDAGNSSEETIAFIVDNTKPQVILNGLNDNGNMNKDKPITLSLKDTNDYFTNIYVNGEKLSLSGDKKTAELIPTEYGSYRIYISARDAAGNVTTETINTNCEAVLAGPDFTETTPLEVKTLVNSTRKTNLFTRTVFLWSLCGAICALAIILVVIAFVVDKNNSHK